jgi:hypothetical protein
LATVAAVLGAGLVAGLVAASTAGAEVRITEALVNPMGADAGQQVVEIANLGSSAVSISGWRLAAGAEVATLPGGLALAGGQRYLIHLSADGANDALHFYTGSSFAPVDAAAHSLALYAASGALTDPAAMRDFVQWGAAGQPHESVAANASLWTAGEYLPISSEGNSMQLCGTVSGTASSWLESSPTLGGPNNCPLVSTASSWGRVKDLYR